MMNAMPYKITLFPHVGTNAPSGTREFATWHALAEFLGQHKEQPKELCQLFSPAEFAIPVRAKENVRHVSLAVLDYDEGLTDAAMAAIIEQARVYQAFMYTSPSHFPPERNKMRVVIALTRPVLRDEWPRFWSTLNADWTIMTALPDQSCKDASRFYYFGGCPIGASAHARTEIFDGILLDVDAVLRRAPAIPAAVVSTIKPAKLKTLQDLAAKQVKRLRKSDSARDAEAADMIDALLAGRDYAEAGERHAAQLILTRHLKDWFSDVDPDSVMALFASSHATMWPDPAKAAAETAETRRAFIGLESSEATASSTTPDQAIDLAKLRNGKAEPYTQAELDMWAARTGHTAEWLRKRWIIQHKQDAYYLIDGNYVYQGPIANVLLDAEKSLLPALLSPDAGVKLTVRTKKGVRPKKREEILFHYASTVQKAEYSYLTDHTYLDETDDKLVLATIKRRPLAPAFHPFIDKWLHLFAGSMWADFELWLKAFPDLSRPLAALYAAGVPGTGKSSLARGLSRLWHDGGFTEASAATDKFNEYLRHCPVVFADECLPEAWLGKSGGQNFRRFIQEDTRTIEAKFASRIPLIGYTRTLLAANNDDLIQSHESNGKEDRDAICDRILFIESGADTAEFLRANFEVNHTLRDEFAKGDIIAAHVLWVGQQCEREVTGRFGVPRQNSEWHRAFKWKDTTIAEVGQWLIKYIRQPGKFQPILNGEPKGEKSILTVGGRLLVHADAMAARERWSVYVNHGGNAPKITRLGDALEEWSNGKTESVGGQAYAVIDTTDLRRYAIKSKQTTAAEFDDKLHALYNGKSLKNDTPAHIQTFSLPPEGIRSL